jgi:hypothetical protein
MQVGNNSIVNSKTTMEEEYEKSEADVEAWQSKPLSCPA